MYWKKWAAKHEYEEPKEGVWFEPALALLRKKVRADWTEKHRNVARKIFLEERLDAKKIVRHWIVGHQSVSSLPDGGRHREAQALPLSGMARNQTGNSGGLQIVGANSANFEERVDVAKRYRHQCEKVSQKSTKSWGMPMEGLKGHVATDGSLQGKAGKW